MPPNNEIKPSADNLSAYLDNLSGAGAGASAPAKGGLDGYLDYLQNQPEPAAPKTAPERTYLEATNDFIIDTANAAAGLVKSGADLVSPESSVSKFIDEKIIKDGQAKQSDRKKFFRAELAAKLGELVSVKDFGAEGDGVTDDTAAVQAAINSVAGSATIFFGVTGLPL